MCGCQTKHNTASFSFFSGILCKQRWNKNENSRKLFLFCLCFCQTSILPNWIFQTESEPVCRMLGKQDFKTLTSFRHARTFSMYVIWHGYGSNGKGMFVPDAKISGILESLAPKKEKSDEGMSNAAKANNRFCKCWPGEGNAIDLTRMLMIALGWAGRGNHYSLFNRQEGDMGFFPEWNMSSVVPWLYWGGGTIELIFPSGTGNKSHVPWHAYWTMNLYYQEGNMDFIIENLQQRGT